MTIEYNDYYRITIKPKPIEVVPLGGQIPPLTPIKNPDTENNNNVYVPDLQAFLPEEEFLVWTEIEDSAYEPSPQIFIAGGGRFQTRLVVLGHNKIYVELLSEAEEAEAPPE